MKLSTIVILLTVLLLSSCNLKNKNQTPIVYDDQSVSDILSMEQVMSDTSKSIKANLPFCFDSTRMVIQPIGIVDIKDRNLLESKISILKDASYNEPYNSFNQGDIVTGRMTNIYFEDVDNKAQRILTDKALNIISMSYLRELSKLIKKDYLSYIVYDQDNNRDGKLDSDDIQACYISRLDGTSFTKVTPDYQQYGGGSWMLWCSRFYFKTIEDTNKDGLFNKKDKEHYFYIDFSANTPVVVEYNPLLIK